MPQSKLSSRGHAFLGDLPQLRTDPLALLTRIAHEPDRVVRLQLPLKPTFLVLDPAEIERILVTDHRQFVKPIWLRTAAVRRLLGDGLVTSDGDAWRGQRRVCSHAFLPELMEGYGKIMALIAAQTVQGWQPSQTLDIQQAMARMTMEIVAQTLLGVPLGVQAEDVSADMDVLMHCFASGTSLYGLLPLPPTARELRAVRRLDEAVDCLIQAGRSHTDAAKESGNEGPLTLLAWLIADDSGEPRRRQRRLREQVKTFLAAGYESSALALTWTFLMLARNPNVDAKLAEELRCVVGNQPLAPSHIPYLPYTRAVLQETLRLYPPLWMTGRQAKQACEVGGHSVPQGALLLTSQWAVHRLPRFFPDPDTFRPERWEGPETADLPRFAYFPFGGGPRVCIGQGFAMMEMTLLLATIVRRFRLSLDAAQDIQPWATMTLRPPAKISMRLTARL